MIDSWLRELRYDHWGNLAVLSALEKAGSEPPRAVELLAHIVAAQRVWLSRVRAEAKDPPVWPKVALAELRDPIDESFDAWTRQLNGSGPTELDRIVEYRNSKGEPWSSTVSDILRHVLYHGAYHRGQIATHLRLAGKEPAYTDYIQAARSGAIA